MTLADSFKQCMQDKLYAALSCSLYQCSIKTSGNGQKIHKYLKVSFTYSKYTKKHPVLWNFREVGKEAKQGRRQQ